MSWGTELWDQYESIALHTQKGLEFCERYAHFVKERCAIEQEYARQLKKLVKNSQPRKKEEEDFQFTCTRSFLSMINEIHDIAGQHEVIAENLNTSIIKEMHTLLHELKQERKKYLQDGQKQQATLSAQLSSLDKSKKQYEKAFREAEKAQEAYKKADADINLSRAEVEKAKNISIAKVRTCEDCKNEYASELQKTNNSQREHYNTLIPQIFQQLQDMDEKRICRVQDFIRRSAEIERNVIPIVNTCIDGMLKAADSINTTEDSKIVVDKYKSGFQPPGDLPFEDLSNSAVTENHNHQSTGHTPKASTLRNETVKGTFSGGKSKKRGGLFGIFSSSKTDDTKDDFSHLPPNQQKKKLNQKIEAIKNSVAKETAERDGMLKMRDVYVKNSQLGDPASLDKQLEENAQKLDKLRQELQKYETYLNEQDSKGNQVAHQKTRQSSIHVSNDSIAHSESDASMKSQHQPSSQPSTPVALHHSQATDSPDSGLVDNNRTSFAEQDSFDDGLDEYILGTCRAIYPFDAANEGSVPMSEGEEFHIVEQDQGDGWTRVRKGNGDEGFVPTSYIECHYY